MKEILEKFTIVDLLHAKKEVPSSKGIYLWTTQNDDVVYIGVALGKKGLRHRICSQHLNTEYLEFRESKHNSKDAFQLEHAIVKTGSNNQIKKGIDKSSFRKSIGRKLSIKPGIGTYEYIYKNLKLKVLVNEDINFVRELEKKLIVELQPIFNSAHK